MNRSLDYKLDKESKKGGYPWVSRAAGNFPFLHLKERRPEVKKRERRK